MIWSSSLVSFGWGMRRFTLRAVHATIDVVRMQTEIFWDWICRLSQQEAGKQIADELQKRASESSYKSFRIPARRWPQDAAPAEPGSSQIAAAQNMPDQATSRPCTSIPRQ